MPGGLEDDGPTTASSARAYPKVLGFDADPSYPLSGKVMARRANGALRSHRPFIFVTPRPPTLSLDPRMSLQPVGRLASSATYSHRLGT